MSRRTPKQETISRRLLERLRFHEGRTLEQMAAIIGVTTGTLIARMRSLGMEWRADRPVDEAEGVRTGTRGRRRAGQRFPISRDLLYELRVVRDLTSERIARRLGQPEGLVHAALARHGIVDRAGRLRPLERLGLGELWWLHYHDRFTVTELALRLRATREEVMARLREVGLPIRPRRAGAATPRRPAWVPRPDPDLIERALAPPAAGRVGRPPKTPRAAAHSLDQATAEELRHLHHTMRLGLTELARHYRVSSLSVVARLTTLGIEVIRRNGRPRRKSWTAEDERRLRGLYDRPEVVEALDRLGVGRGRSGARLDPPVDLTRPLLEELYVTLKLSTTDIGVLTGRGQATVSSALRRAGIEIRRRMPRPDRRADGGPPRLPFPIG